ncbi:hypothetical protein CVM50_15565 [Pseudooceanicola marinus]|nr:hypothetical protein CVM50_15565 [Pseudooceanicola marinus]
MLRGQGRGRAGQQPSRQVAGDAVQVGPRGQLGAQAAPHLDCETHAVAPADPAGHARLAGQLCRDGLAIRALQDARGAVREEDVVPFAQLAALLARPVQGVGNVLHDLAGVGGGGIGGVDEGRAGAWRTWRRRLGNCRRRRRDQAAGHRGPDRHSTPPPPRDHARRPSRLGAEARGAGVTAVAVSVAGALLSVSPSEVILPEPGDLCDCLLPSPAGPRSFARPVGGGAAGRTASSL